MAKSEKTESDKDSVPEYSNILKGTPDKGLARKESCMQTGIIIPGISPCAKCVRQSGQPTFQGFKVLFTLF